MAAKHRDFIALQAVDEGDLVLIDLGVLVIVLERHVDADTGEAAEDQGGINSLDTGREHLIVVAEAVERIRDSRGVETCPAFLHQCGDVGRSVQNHSPAGYVVNMTTLLVRGVKHAL
jgi:hypothetical protein